MPQFSPFVHLHVHSHYSLGDSINRVSDLYRKAGEYNMNSLALTDHGNLFGAAEFMLDVPTPARLRMENINTFTWYFWSKMKSVTRISWSWFP